jgi:hypothetical protein
MRGPHVEPLRSSRFYPTANDALTRKQKGMESVSVDDGQFNISVERGCNYRFPHSLICHLCNAEFNSGHVRRSAEAHRVGQINGALA